MQVRRSAQAVPAVSPGGYTVASALRCPKELRTGISAGKRNEKQTSQ